MLRIVRKAKSLYDHTLRGVVPIHNLVRVSLWNISGLFLAFVSRLARFELPKEDIAPYFRFHIVMGRYQPEVVALYRHLLRPGMIVVDVGAHAGYHTLRFARLVRPGGKVIAFEPSPDNFSTLERNVRRHGLSNVVLEQKAVGNANGVMPLYHSYSSLGHTIVRPLSRGEHTPVDCVSLDTHFERLGVGDVNLVKINVEGAEVDVLSGMCSLLRRSANPWLIAEFYPRFLEAAGYPPSRLLNLLFGLGFQVYKIERYGSLTPLEAYGCVDDFASSVTKFTSIFARKRQVQ